MAVNAYVGVTQWTQSFVVFLAGRIPQRQWVFFAIDADVAGVIVEHSWHVFIWKFILCVCDE